MYVNGVNQGTRFEGTYNNGGGTPLGSCTDWTDYTTWTPALKGQMQEFALAQFDSLRNFFFWTWKIGANSNGVIPNPMWSYQLGLQQGEDFSSAE